MEIEYGYCHCGCGQKTSIAKHNDERRGVLKGECYKFVQRHTGRMVDGVTFTDSDGYVLRKDRTHPRRNYSNRVRDHILIAEKVLGKILPDGAVVHHVNGDPADNRKENLVICQNQAYHVEIHRRQRTLLDCGNPDFRKCKHCHQYDSPNNLTFSIDRRQAFHKACRNLYEMCRKRKIRERENAKRDNSITAIF